MVQLQPRLQSLSFAAPPLLLKPINEFASRVWLGFDFLAGKVGICIQSEPGSRASKTEIVCM